MTTHARNTDPATSHASAQLIEQNLVLRPGTQVFRLLEVYAQKGAPKLTDAEAAQQAEMLRTGYWKRCSDLRNAGHITPAGTALDEHTHRRVRTCKITPEGRKALREAVKLSK